MITPRFVPSLPDETDREIIRLLQGDPDLSHRGIAKHVGLTQPAVSARIARLRRTGHLRLQAGMDVAAVGLVLAKVDVATPDNRQVSLFVEGPTPDWALPLPAKVDGAPAGQQRFAFDLDGLPAVPTPRAGPQRPIHEDDLVGGGQLSQQRGRFHRAHGRQPPIEIG